MQKIGDRRATATRRGNRFLSVRTQRTSARGREDGFGGGDYRGWVCGGDEQEDEETGGEDDGGGAGAGESSRDFGAGCCGAGGAGADAGTRSIAALAALAQVLALPAVVCVTGIALAAGVCV